MISLVVAAATSLIFSLIVTPRLISALYKRGFGQQIREDGPKAHATKAGTPTMGGICIVAGGAMGYVAAHFVGSTVFTSRGLLCVAALVCAGVVGALDDWLKIRNRRNLGLNKRAKIGGQLFVALGFVIAARSIAHLPAVLGVIGNQTADASFNWQISLPVVVWVAICAFIVIGSANAVNLTDGLDGLAAGSSAFAFAACAVLGFWQWRHGPDFSLNPAFNAPYALDLAIFAIAMSTACVGFLWWNAAPAQIFMGDTGSLAIGTALAALAISLDVELLLPIIGGLFVIETLAVIIQITAFRFFGKRVFRMAPLHHHYELGGWPETTVIIRFWIVAGFFVASSLGLYYAAYQVAVR